MARNPATASGTNAATASKTGAAIITPEATGTANTLVAKATTGMVPNHINTNGDTPSWAAVVAANTDEPKCGVMTTSPVVAATDNTNPTDHVANGSSPTMPSTVIAKARNGTTSRPIAKPICTTAAITAARTTLDSKRVTTANIDTTPKATAKRGHRLSRRSPGVRAAKMSATFCPDTASKCPSPAPRNASVIR